MCVYVCLCVCAIGTMVHMRRSEVREQMWELRLVSLTSLIRPSSKQLYVLNHLADPDK